LDLNPRQVGQIHFADVGYSARCENMSAGFGAWHCTSRDLHFNFSALAG
jgi:hypothetical protein